MKLIWREMEFFNQFPRPRIFRSHFISLFGKLAGNNNSLRSSIILKIVLKMFLSIEKNAILVCRRKDGFEFKSRNRRARDSPRKEYIRNVNTNVLLISGNGDESGTVDRTSAVSSGLSRPGPRAILIATVPPYLLLDRSTFKNSVREFRLFNDCYNSKSKL